MKKRQLTAVLMSLILGAGLLAGCGSSSSNSSSVTAEQESSAESLVAAEAEQESSAESRVITDELAPLALNSALSGSLGEIQKLGDLEVIDDAQAEEKDRAIRAHVDEGGVDVVNRAETFYYYEQLDADVKEIYDALYELCCHPDPDYLSLLVTEVDPASTEFAQNMLEAYYSMLYDHPEIFWVYNSIESSIGYGSTGKPTDSMYVVYFGYTDTFSGVEEKVEAFNDAAEEFLEDIDDTGTETETAQQIHDKLCDLVVYDNDTAEQDKMGYAHTAYGALVENGEGVENSAVCDGYSLAYEYLLQQVGIESIVMVGKAGNDAESAGNHAWNLAYLDEQWVEIDSTWDDIGSREEYVESLKTSDPLRYKYYTEALQDSTYANRMSNYLNRVSTATISNYVSGSEDFYTTKDGIYMFNLIGDSIHQRADEENFGVMGDVVATAPTAP